MIRALTSLSVAALVLGSACPLGPQCPSPFTNPSATATFTPDASVFVVRWTPNGELSSDYYAAPRVWPLTEPGLSRGGDAGVLRLTARPPSEVEVELEPSAPRGFSLAFPDPRGRIRCTHVGMDDTYLIDVDARDGGVRVRESVDLGAL